MTAERFITLEQLKLITEEQAKFILEHAEKQLNDIVGTHDAIVSRTTTVLTLMIGMVTALSAYAIDRFNINKLDEMFITSIMGAFYILIIVFKLNEVFKPTTYWTVGAEPKDFFIDRVFNEQNGSIRLKQIYVNEILQYQHKITMNKATNEKRWGVFKSSINWMKLIPIVLLLTFLTAKILIHYL